MSMDVYACLAVCCLALCCLLPRPPPQVLLVSCSRAMSLRFHAHVSCPLLAHSYMCVWGGVARIARGGNAGRAARTGLAVGAAHYRTFDGYSFNYQMAGMCAPANPIPWLHPSIRPSVSSFTHTVFGGLYGNTSDRQYNSCRAIFTFLPDLIHRRLVVAYVCTPRVTCAGEFILSRHMNDVELQNEQVSSRCLSQCRAVCRSAGLCVAVQGCAGQRAPMVVHIFAAPYCFWHALHRALPNVNIHTHTCTCGGYLHTGESKATSKP